MKILNLTQHNLTPEQLVDGIFEPDEIAKKKIQELLTFNDFQDASPQEMRNRAKYLSLLVKDFGVSDAMIGGASYFMPYLAAALRWEGVKPWHAFTKRVAIPISDGIHKRVFKYECLVEDGGFHTFEGSFLQ